ncbi:restriction endonuclease subunit S [Hoylesella nanceiensis]|jgi:type I restriction-modification system specificity subunit|uniref:restriction endonuclease subunit S n=1 Tax=Hoylesella nanceiensis TaxID=425941 RepID=UPI0028D646D8|nr:restriction endonuclease subunit S [Hoylesella nanceiensis]MDU2165460.1 restriction endonuclease subunit S [Veillonella sp.]
MEYVKLKDITTKITKGTTPSNIGDSFTDEGINYFRSEMLGKAKYLDKSSGMMFISESTHNKLKRSQIEADDILFSMAGIYLGKLAIVKDEDVPANTNQAVALIRFNKGVNIDYLYYFMVQKSFNAYVNCMSAQAAQPNINLKQIGNLQIVLPTDKQQKRIAGILSAYDNLIENNNKRIRLLEQMAENLYKEWFVRFRFPGYEDTEFEDGMPRDWVREKIGLHYNTCSGGTPSRTHEEYYTEGTIPWVKTGEIKDGIIIHTDECITEAGIKGSSAKLLPQGAVVMAMYGVNIGMLAYLDSEMTCNQACCVFNDKNEINSRHYLFHYLYSIRDYLLLIGFGAAQQNLSQDLIKKVKIVIPPAELIKEFDKQKEPLYQTIRALMMKNDKLIKQRDALLPRLMSGKLEV